MFLWVVIGLLIFFLACYYFLCDEISARKLKSGRNYKVQKDWERVHNNVALCACVLCTYRESSLADYRRIIRYHDGMDKMAKLAT